MKLHILFACGEPIAVSKVPFVLPEYGNKSTLEQRVYEPTVTVREALEWVDKDLPSSGIYGDDGYTVADLQASKP